MRKPLVEATIRETTRKKRTCPSCVSIGTLGGVPAFNSEGCPTHGEFDVVVTRVKRKDNQMEIAPSGPGAALAIMSIQEESAEKESLAREKTITDLILIVGNIKDQLAVVDRILLTLQGTCLSCGEKKELPPVLNGLCSDCEMEL